ncbi:MAG: SRPBCC family protein [Planctomycetia bacterium]|nr:SRPBCC family protein [Planctomycetia bacterium]
MNARTYSLTVPAPKSRVFAYLADVENLPEWATEFCQGLEVIDGEHWATTPAGKVLCRIRAHEPTGTIDYLAGPSKDQLAAWPARVVELSDEQSLFQFTVMQLPGMSDDEFAAHCAGLQKEFRNILCALETVHV